jgi:single-strand DNA-binding protein
MGIMDVKTIGNLTDDCRVRQTNDGTTVANFTVCYNNRKTQDRLFLQCSLWGNLASALQAYLKKGTQVFVEGELSVREFEHNDEKRWSLECRTRTIQLLGSKEAIRNDVAQTQATRMDNADKENSKTDLNDLDDEIPF